MAFFLASYPFLPNRGLLPHLSNAPLSQRYQCNLLQGEPDSWIHCSDLSLSLQDSPWKEWSLVLPLESFPAIREHLGDPRNSSQCSTTYIIMNACEITYFNCKFSFWKGNQDGGGGIVNGVISLIFLLAVAAQRVPHTKPQSMCTYSWQKSCGFAGFPLGFCLLFRHPPEHVTVGLLGSLRLFRVIRTTLHTNKTAFNCVEMSDKTTLSLEMKAAYGSTEVTEQRQETSKIDLTSWTLGWLLW